MSNAVVASESALSAEDARELTDRIKAGVEVIWQLVVQAFESRAWSALGYSSWDDYCTREFGTSRLRLPKEERQEVIASLRESGLSHRAIAAATGLSKGTVGDALAGAQNRAPEQEERVTGTDGKAYPAKPATVIQRLHQTAAELNPRSREGLAVRVARAREMAAEGYTSRQIATEVGVTPESMPAWRERHGIEVPADAAMGKSRRHDSNLIIAETVTTLEAVAMSLNVVEIDQLDPERIEMWATSLTDSTRSLNRFLKQIKEMTRGSE